MRQSLILPFLHQLTMRIAATALTAFCLTQIAAPALGFSSPTAFRGVVRQSSPAPLFAVAEDEKVETASADASSINGDASAAAADPDAEGLPWWWELVWDLDIMKRGTPGEEIIFGDSAHVLRTNIEQIYGGYPSLDRCPLGEGDIADIADGTMFIGLQRYQQNYGSPYKLCFGPKVRLNYQPTFICIVPKSLQSHILPESFCCRPTSSLYCCYSRASL